LIAVADVRYFGSQPWPFTGDQRRGGSCKRSDGERAVSMPAIAHEQTSIGVRD
jgi:hypothetical protein